MATGAHLALDAGAVKDTGPAVTIRYKLLSL